MMKLLLDPHIFLWFVEGNSRLAAHHRTAIEDSGNSVFLSVGSIWEAVTKHRLGKLQLPGSPAEYLLDRTSALGMVCLPIDERSVLQVAELPLIHRDPFDRIIIAQSIQHGLKLVTEDSVMKSYPVDIL